MSVNGWFASTNVLGDILSGNAGLFRTVGGVSVQLAPVGTTGAWAGLAPLWNRNDGHTVFNMGKVLPHAYNEYRGRDDGYWAGAIEAGPGEVHLYENDRLVAPIATATKPRLGGGRFAYIAPFQGTTARQLVVDFVVRQQGSITNAAISTDGHVLIYQTDYRHIWAEDHAPTGTPLNVVPQENPRGCFVADGLAWVASETPTAGGEILVHPVQGPSPWMGYRLTGILSESFWRMQGAQLHGVGADAHGLLREVWINFSEPRTDLRH